MNAVRPDADLLNKAQALGVAARGIVEGLRVGDHRSPFRGFSVEFVQHREYVPGDDTRHIDWKSYGRSERYTIKQFEQETNFVAHLLLDTSRSMDYGDGPSNKLEVGRLLAATLAYVVIHQRDSAALSLFADGWRGQWPAGAQPGYLVKLLEALAAVEASGGTALAPVLNDLAGKTRRRGLVFVITDALEEAQALLQGLRHLRFRDHEVTLFQVLHRDELDFPFDGQVRFLGMESPAELRTRPRQIREGYLRAFAAHREMISRGCEAGRVDYVAVDTGRALTATLAEHLARRRRVASQR